ncbi:MAG: hypothetical protein VZQ81_09325, partial [Succiniclasticum sp.]|nr:hypothetical protein [Succiniclasticum sp.]
MADTRKPSRVVSDTLGIPPKDYGLMDINARRYERTDAGVEDAILRQIFAHPKAKEFLDNPKTDPDVKEFVYNNIPGEFGRTKVLSAGEVLKAMGVEVPKKEDDETPEQKLVRKYDENRNFVTNRVRMDKALGDVGADNLPMLVAQARGHKKPKPEVGLLNSIAGSFLYPRSLESMQAGREVSGKDIGGDIAENVLMALPIGWAAGAAKGGRAARIALGALGAGAVPLATETIDSYMYNPSENLDRSVFQPSDVAIGASTNLAAPFMLSRATGRLGKWLYGGNPIAKEAEVVVKGGSPDAKMIVNSWLDDGKWSVPTKAERMDAQYELMDADALKKAFDPEYGILARNAFDYSNGIVNEATEKAFKEFAALEAKYMDMLDRAQLAAGFMKQGKSLEDAMLMANSLTDDIAAELTYRMNKPSRSKEIAGATLGSWATNKYGNNRNANATLGLASGLVQTVQPDVDLMKNLEELRKERTVEANDKLRASAATDATMGGLGAS